ncbi:protein phosphatase 2C domain-containing protein [Umezawaea sp. Da 62-37]|uniref:PP2C family protein-serine/threonine phosphatase n=1 Tax=Umezawaea sp. Da 62-37 TaxID=3075927 RepID=UPI0028F74265|nr:protein phosphatase 2C domain-containing protein [Umezawaea sp. Da 62-37]WNV85322.1 protein phosphatase 2C domain-containing protein [Umezawaea sp. Da 62-37]
MTPSVLVVAMTCTGAVRRTNEDRVGVFGWLAPVGMGAPTGMRRAATEPLVVAVADGLGGHAAGEVASRRAVTALMDDPRSLVDERALLGRYLDVHTSLLASGRDHPEQRGMATTLASVVVLPDTVLVCNVGDSRVYYVEPGYVEQLTVDDVDPMGSGALVQVLGGLHDSPAEPRVSSLPLTTDIRLLLCSDGLHGSLPTDVLRSSVVDQDPYAAVTALHEAAHRAGAPDNISLCLVHITLPTPAEDDRD